MSSVERNLPYLELEKRSRPLPYEHGTGVGSRNSNNDDADDDHKESWGQDLERGAMEEGFIRKTVTIDQTSRTII